MGTILEWEGKIPEEKKYSFKIFLAQESWLLVLNLCGGLKDRHSPFPPFLLQPFKFPHQPAPSKCATTMCQGKCGLWISI